MVVTIIQKAERLPDGRVKGYGPSQLWPKVARVLTSEELAKVLAVQAEAFEVARKKRQVLLSFGLDPRKGYRFSKTGEVIEIGKYHPRY